MPTKLQNTNEQTQEQDENQANETHTFALETELAEWKDKFLRLASEFENYKKRTLKEKADLINYANEQVLLQLLPILDDFERTIKVLNATDNTIKEGITMVFKNLQKSLQKSGLEQTECYLQPFNDTLHEAIGSLPVDNPEHKNKVIEVLESGYALNGKMIRYAKVLVGA